VDVYVGEHVLRIPLLPPPFKSSKMIKLAAFTNYVQISYFLHGFRVPKQQLQSLRFSIALRDVLLVLELVAL